MSEQYPSQMRAIGVPMSVVKTDTLYADDSTYTQGGAEAGVPTSTSDLRIDPSGTPTEAMTVRTQASGLAGRDGATFVARSGSGSWVGWDLPVGIRNREVLANISGTTTPTDHTACIASPDGALLVAEARYSSGINTIRVHRQEPGAGWATTTAALATSESSFIAAPALCALPSGRVLLFVVVYDTANNLAQVRQLYSDNDGVSFSVGANYVLPESIDSSTVTINRMAVAESAGQLSLVLSVTDDGKVKPYQYASNDLGSSFTLVFGDVAAAFGVDVGTKHWDVVGLSVGGFMLAALYTSSTDGTGSVLTLSLVIPSAFTPINDGTFTAGSTSGILISGVYQQWPALCVDDTGSVWLHVIGKGAGVGQATVTHDNGTSWNPIGSTESSSTAGQWWDTGTLEAGPWGMSSAYLNGSVYVAHYTTEVSSVEGGRSPAVLRLGGYTSVTLPAVDQFVSKTNGLAYSLTYAGMSSPETYGLTKVGTMTEGLDGNGWLTTEVAGVAIAYIDTVATDHAVGQIHHFVGQRKIGDLYLTSQVSDGTNGWGITINWDASGIEAEDASGATLFTLTAEEFATITGAAEFLVALSSSGYTVGIRPSGNSETPFIMHKGSTTSVINTAERFLWGTTAGGGSNSFRTISYARAVSSDFATSIANDFTSPDDLRGFPLSGDPRYVRDGLSLSAVGGPALVADTHSIPVGYRWPIDHIHTDSPSEEWRSADATAGQVIAYELETVDDGHVPVTGVVGIYIRGANFAAMDVEVTDGIASSYSTTMANVDLTTAFAYTRTGQQIRPITTGDVIAGPYVHEGQLIGSHFQLDSSTVLTIVGNTSGWLTSGSATAVRRCVITLEGVTNSEPSSGDGSVWHKDALVIVHRQQNPIGRLRLTIHPNSEPEPPEGYFKAGLVRLLDMHIPAMQYSHGRRVVQERLVDITTSATGRSRARQRGPIRRVVDLRWEGSLMTQRIMGDCDPMPVFSSTEVGAWPVASHGGTAGLLAGLHATQGEGCALYVPRLDQETGSPVQRFFAYHDGPIWGRFDVSIPYEVETGNEQESELARMGLTVTECT